MLQLSLFSFTLKKKKKTLSGHLAGSVSKAYNSLSWGCKLEPQVGSGDYLNIKSKAKQRKTKTLK